MTAVWKRARSDEQKRHRRVALLDAATRLLASHAIDEISLNTIAREANISKASVYRYFESREEVFLHLTLQAVERWSADLIRRLPPPGQPDDAEAVATAIVSTTLDHEDFARLTSVLATVLERNVSVDVVVPFKQQVVAAVATTGTALQQALPDLSAEDTRQLLQLIYFQIVGMWPAAHPSEAVLEALRRPELASAAFEFGPSLHAAVVVTVAGLRARARS